MVSPKPFPVGLCRNLLDQATPELACEDSVLDYHAPGLDYLCLHRSAALTVKVYLSDPERLKPCGESDYIVNPHDHGYNFDTYVVRGFVDNITLQEFPGNTFGELLFDWRSRSFAPSGRRVDLGETRRGYGPGDGYYLDCETVHTLSILGNVPLVLLLLQYADRREGTRLFTRGGKLPLLQGLYRRPNVAEAGALILRAKSAFDRLRRGAT